MEARVQSPAQHRGLKDLAVLQLWHRWQLGLKFSLWPENLDMQQMQPLKNKKKRNKF